MMMLAPGAGAPPAPPMGGAGAGAAPGAAVQKPGAPPGGMGSLLGMMPGSTPAPSDPSEAIRGAMNGVEQLAQSIKQNPQMIEVLAAVMKTHPVLRLVFLAASRRPEQRGEAAQVSGGQKVPPILGR